MKKSAGAFAALSLLTITTGLIDAATVLGFTVFAANMTGNIVFLGFSLGGSPEYALVPSVAALVGFVLGAWGAGFIVPAKLAPRPASTALGVQAVLIGVAAVVAMFSDAPGSTWQDWLILLILGAAMGLQNVISLASPVADMKTTVLTLTIAGIASELARGTQQRWGLRLVSIVLLLNGALGGTLIFLQLGMGWTLLAASVITAMAAVIFRSISTGDKWAAGLAREA